jgi:hypothetical protein
MPTCHVNYGEGLLSTFDGLPKHKSTDGVLLSEAVHGYSKPVEVRQTSLEFTNKLNNGLKAYALGQGTNPNVDAATNLPCFSGSCHCGSVTFKVRGTPNFAVNCHCSLCRRTHGTAHVALCGYQNSDVEVTSKGGKKALALYQSTGDGEWEGGLVVNEDRYSCKDCGTKVLTDLNQLGCTAVFPSNFSMHEHSACDPRFRPSAHIFYPSGVLDSYDELPKLQGFPPAFGGSDGRLFRNDYHNGACLWPWKEARGQAYVSILALVMLFGLPIWNQLLRLIGAGAEWRAMPWRVFMSPFEQWQRLPSFLFIEYWYFTLTLISLWHARRNGALDLWFAAWICGTFNDVFTMFLPLIDNFWQAQATVMLTPRLPLYIVALYVCLMYPANTAAMRFGFRWSLAEAMCAGLLACAWYGVYDVAGPRLLWWTWHDSDVAIGVRLGNAPVGSTMWILTYTFCFNLLYRWATRYGTGEWTALMCDAATLVRKYVTPHAGPSLGDMGEAILSRIAAVFEGVQQFFRYRPTPLTIFVVALTCTPMFMVLLGQFSILSLDIPGKPGVQTLSLCCIVFAGTVLKALFAAIPPLQGNQEKTAAMLAPRVRQWVAPGLGDRVLGAAVLFHFVLVGALLLFSDPETHVSTGVHQKFHTCEYKAYDIMFFERNDFLCHNETVFGPWENSEADYIVGGNCGVGLKERLHATGTYTNHAVTVYSETLHRERTYDLSEPVTPSMENDPDWYTVCGIREPDYVGDKHSAWGMLRTAAFQRQCFIAFWGSTLFGYIFLRSAGAGPAAARS